MAYYLKTTGNKFHNKLIFIGDRGYTITSDGDLFIADTGRKLKKNKMTSGYYFYRIRCDGTYKNVSAHRLVAKFFVHNPFPLKFSMVNHIDGNKLNNESIRTKHLKFVFNKPCLV